MNEYMGFQNLGRICALSMGIVIQWLGFIFSKLTHIRYHTYPISHL